MSRRAPLPLDGAEWWVNRYLCAGGADLSAMRALPPPRLDVGWDATGRTVGVGWIGAPEGTGKLAVEAWNAEPIVYV